MTLGTQKVKIAAIFQESHHGCLIHPMFKRGSNGDASIKFGKNMPLGISIFKMASTFEKKMLDT